MVPDRLGDRKWDAAVVAELPLTGLVVAAGNTTATKLAARLLEQLGASVDATGLEPSDPGRDPEADWGASHLAAVTGRTDGTRLLPVGEPATFASACALGIETLSTRAGTPVHVDGPTELGARLGVLQERGTGGTTSVGGATRLLQTSDGWCAVTLPRLSDLALVPALTGDDSGDDPWIVASRWAASRSKAEIEIRAELLGIAAAGVADPPVPKAPWKVNEINRLGGGMGSRLVVNLGSLWAAPLCAQVLHRAGYHVVDIESPARPDGARASTPPFYARLHDGHERVVLALDEPAGRQGLRELLREATVVITGSRARSLSRLGVTRAAVAARNDQVWVSITGYGKDSERSGFGDDAAAAAGLVAWDRDGPVFVGDAIADPLTGLAAALATLAALGSGGGWDIELALCDVAAAAATWRLTS